MPDNFTKTKVGSRVAAAAVLIATVIGVSALTATLIPSTGSGKFYGSGDTTGTIGTISLDTGYCITGFGLLEPKGEHTTSSACKGRATDDDPKTEWYLFCPDDQTGSGSAKGSCSCDDTGVQKSSKLNEIISKRDGTIDSLNDGNLSEADLVDYSQITGAAKLKCACSVFTAGNYDTSADDGNPNTSADAARKLYTIYLGGKEVKGVHTFLRKVAKMYSRMYDSAPKCELLPDGCYPTSSYRGDEGGLLHKQEHKFVLYEDWTDVKPSGHDIGKAMDIGCWNQAASSGGCTGPAATVESKVRSAASGLNVIRECNKLEKQICGSGSTQVVHVDEKSRGTKDPNEEACYFIDCNFGDCKSVPPLPPA